MKAIFDYPPNIKIPVDEVIDYARELMNPEDIDHHGLGNGMDDLYLKVNAISQWIVRHMENKSLVSTFTDNIEGKLWYELPFLYHD